AKRGCGADRRRGGGADLGRGRAGGDEHRRDRDQQQLCQRPIDLDAAAARSTTAAVCARLSHVVSLLCRRINSPTRELSIVQTLTQLTWLICLGILRFCCSHTWVASLILWFHFSKTQPRVHASAMAAASAMRAPHFERIGLILRRRLVISSMLQSAA